MRILFAGAAALAVAVLSIGCNSPAVRALSAPQDGLPSWMHEACGPQPNVCPGSPPSCCGETDACSGGPDGVGQPGCETVGSDLVGSSRTMKPRHYAPR